MATIWQKAFSRIFWKNRPKTGTPLGESKLLPMDASIDEIDNRVVTLQQTKAEQSDFLTSIKNIQFNRQTGVFTITKFNDTTFTIDTDLEKIAVNFDYDDDPTSAHYQQIILTLIDGTVKYIDLSALITQYEFTDSATIDFSVGADGKISATVIDGSITESKLQPNYLGDIRVETAKSQQYMTNAQTAQNAAETAQGLAEDAQEAAETAQGLAETAQTGAEDARDRASASATSASTSETNALASATQAETYASNASTSASNASTSESNASTYAANASNSASSAGQSATSASDSAQDSEAWAVGKRNGVDVPSTDPRYHNNSKYYAEQAETSLSNTVRSFNGRNGAVAPTDGDYNIEQISPLNGAQVGQVPVVTNIGTEEDPELVFKMGAGGGGGHSIIDSEGNTMPQETAMQFPDSFVSDDETNGRTIVENIKEHTTKADYDNATEDGFHVIDDGEDAVIHPSSDDYVEVEQVTGGTKTYATLLNELYALVDFNKVSKNAILTLNGIIYNPIIVQNDGCYFSRSGIEYNLPANFEIGVLESNSYYNFYQNNQYTNRANDTVPVGTKFTLYYGNKKAVVDLQTTANRCLLPDGETTVADVVDCDKTTAGTYALKCTVDAQGNKTYSWV